MSNNTDKCIQDKTRLKRITGALKDLCVWAWKYDTSFIIEELQQRSLKQTSQQQQKPVHWRLREMAPSVTHSENCHTWRTKHVTSFHLKAVLQFCKQPLVYLRKSLRLDSSWSGKWTMMGSFCVCPWRRCGALARRTALWALSEPQFAYRETSASSSSCSSL